MRRVLAWLDICCHHVVNDLGRVSPCTCRGDGCVPALGRGVFGGLGEELAGGLVKGYCPGDERLVGDSELAQGAFDRAGHLVVWSSRRDGCCGELRRTITRMMRIHA
jgi:hypothetical protein